MLDKKPYSTEQACMDDKVQEPVALVVSKQKHEDKNKSVIEKMEQVYRTEIGWF